ncbi:hypothetical protein TNCV_2865311 [Trichonephila clavipes]|nr:hypothetical protein TNCV_2865311 [Trichonephila clavipes]
MFGCVLGYDTRMVNFRSLTLLPLPLRGRCGEDTHSPLPQQSHFDNCLLGKTPGARFSERRLLSDNQSHANHRNCGLTSGVRSIRLLVRRDKSLTFRGERAANQLLA